MTNRKISVLTSYLRNGLLCAVVMMASAAEARQVRLGVIVPSEFWQAQPALSDTPPVVHRVPLNELRRDCDMVGVIPEWAPLEACTLFSGAPGWPPSKDRKIHCDIFIGDVFSGEHYRLLELHERAHCAGWPGSHPDAIDE